jgi:YesN/AraC family two-component response regulator
VSLEFETRFLIVDDEPFNLVALQGLLEFMKHDKIDKALNGREALELVKANPFKYSIVITDN